jgi:hypothetical protein
MSLLQCDAQSKLLSMGPRVLRVHHVQSNCCVVEVTKAAGTVKGFAALFRETAPARGLIAPGPSSGVNGAGDGPRHSIVRRSHPWRHRCSILLIAPTSKAVSTMRAVWIELHGLVCVTPRVWGFEDRPRFPGFLASCCAPHRNAAHLRLKCRPAVFCDNGLKVKK